MWRQTPLDLIHEHGADAPVLEARMNDEPPDQAGFVLHTCFHRADYHATRQSLKEYVILKLKHHLFKRLGQRWDRIVIVDLCLAFVGEFLQIKNLFYVLNRCTPNNRYCPNLR